MAPPLEVFNRISLLAVLTDGQGRVTFVNEAAKSAGFLQLEDHFSPITFPSTMRLVKSMGTSTDRFTTRIEGAPRPRLIEWNPSEYEKDLWLYLGQDVTRDRQSYAALKEYARKAANASDTKMRFLATMSHEMRTPLNGILGMTGLLLDTPLDSNQKTYAEAVRESGSALLGLINDILDYSKIEAGWLELEEHSFDPAALLQSVAELLSPRAANKGLEIASYVAPDVPLRLKGDEGRLRQVLLNLATNGVKFSETGGVSMELRCLSKPTDSEAQLHFNVQDTGIGIAEEDIKKVFQEFSQADDTSSRNQEGTGLGLAIAQHIVKAMGGEIKIKSKVGEGSSFSFTVTMALGEEAPERRSAAPIPMPVVVATDNSFLRRTLSLQLEAAGVSHIFFAENPGEALSHLKRAPTAALLCDLPLAASDGARLAKAAPIALVLLSPFARGRLEAFKRAGFSGYLIKPIRQESLVERLTGAPPPITPRNRLDQDYEEREGDEKALPKRRLRVLLAEDNQINSVLATAILKRAGHHVDVAGNGAEAVETFTLAEYDIVLMDMRMPEMDGLEATKALRAAGHIDVPIIALTANAMGVDREACLQAGMNDFLSKPFDPNDLTRLLDRWTQKPPSDQIDISQTEDISSRTI
ncbi:MAG: response regulator [Pseudomonadota bacterium]